MRARNQKCGGGWMDGPMGKKRTTRPGPTGRTGRGRKHPGGMAPHRDPCTSKMLIQQAGGPPPQGPLSSLVAASWLNTQLERVQGVGFERKGQRDCASVRAPLAGRKSRAAAFSPAYRRTACCTTRSTTCARSVSCGKTKGTDAVTVIRLL